MALMCKIGMSEQREYAIAAYLLPHFPHILANSYTWQAGSSRIQEAKSIIENATCYYAPALSMPIVNLQCCIPPIHPTPLAQYQCISTL